MKPGRSISNVDIEGLRLKAILITMSPKGRGELGIEAGLSTFGDPQRSTGWRGDRSREGDLDGRKATFSFKYSSF